MHFYMLYCIYIYNIRATDRPADVQIDRFSAKNVRMCYNSLSTLYVNLCILKYIYKYTVCVGV